MTSDEKLRDRIAGRKHAQEVLGCAELTGRSPDFLDNFWRWIALQCFDHIELHPERPKLVPMDDAQAKWFAISEMPFGKHEGRPVGYVLDNEPYYLDWLVRATEEDKFKENLRRFLARKDVADKIPDQDDRILF